MSILNLKKKIEKPLIIMGCCNSGTTILWDALKEHKDLSGPVVEGQDLEGMPKPMIHFISPFTFRMWAHHLFQEPNAKHSEDSKLPGSKLAYYFTEKDVTQEYKEQISSIYHKNIEDGKRLCDKSPAHTLRARFIQGCFPDAYFITIIRNGYAVSEGIIRKRYEDLERPKYTGLETMIEDAAVQWCTANEVIVSYKEYNLLKRLHILKYEDLVENPYNTLLSVLDFCNLDTKNFPIPSFDKDLNDKQISRLVPNDIEKVTEIARFMLEYFQYI